MLTTNYEIFPTMFSKPTISSSMSELRTKIRKAIMDATDAGALDNIQADINAGTFFKIPQLDLSGFELERAPSLINENALSYTNTPNSSFGYLEVHYAGSPFYVCCHYSGDPFFFHLGHTSQFSIDLGETFFIDTKRRKIAFSARFIPNRTYRIPHVADVEIFHFHQLEKLLRDIENDLKEALPELSEFAELMIQVRRKELQ